MVPDQGAVGENQGGAGVRSSFSFLEITVVSVEALVVDCMFWRRPEGAGWYDWVLLRSQLEEGADSEEELWVTDESDTDSEESDIGDGKDD